VNNVSRSQQDGWLARIGSVATVPNCGFCANSMDLGACDNRSQPGGIRGLRSSLRTDTSQSNGGRHELTKRKGPTSRPIRRREALQFEFGLSTPPRVVYSSVEKGRPMNPSYPICGPFSIGLAMIGFCTAIGMHRLGSFTPPRLDAQPRPRGASAWTSFDPHTIHRTC
jgi:hypothetical protein